MAQIFDRSSNALARMSLVLTGLIVIALGVTLDGLQRSPWVTRQGQAAGPAGAVQPQAPCAGTGAAMPVLSRHGREVELRGHTADQDLYQLPLANLDQRRLAGACRKSWATGESLVWTKVHDLPITSISITHPCEQGPGMRQLSWPRGPDAADVSADSLPMGGA